MPTGGDCVNPKVLQVADLICIVRDGERGIDLVSKARRGLGCGREAGRIRPNHTEVCEFTNFASPNSFRALELV